MTIAALVDEAAGLVVNLIVADPATDPAPIGFVLVGLPPDEPIAAGYSYAGGIFTAPVPSSDDDPLEGAPQPEPEAE